MPEKTLIANVRPDEGDADTLLVTSPVVGMADGSPKVGVFLNPFDRIITMKILHERYVLRLPREVHGRVTEVFIPNSFTPVAYGEALARLDPRVFEGEAASAAGGAGGAGTRGEAGESGLVTVPAPSDGIFYRRSAPDAPAYVEVGSPVSSGTILGLVEIMKCFHQIAYGGVGLPERGEVVEVLAEDAAEVRFGQALFKVKPSG